MIIDEIETLHDIARCVSVAIPAVEYGNDMLHEVIERIACQLDSEKSIWQKIADERYHAWELVEKHGGIDAVKRRLMPEGYEWPRYETGELLRYKDRYINDGAEREVWHVDFDSYGDATILNIDGSKCSLDKGERVKRPTPKALDADGVEILVGDVLYRKSDGRMVKVADVYEKIFIDADDCVRPGDGFTHRAPVLAADGKPLEVGQTVYGTRDQIPVEVIATHSHEYDGIRTVKCKDANGCLFYCPEDLTHDRHVLDADGVEIRDGDTVWDVESGTEYEVVGIRTDEDSPVRVMRTDGSHLAKAANPRTLTHERPETRQSIVDEIGEDMAKRIDAIVSAGRWQGTRTKGEQK